MDILSPTTVVVYNQTDLENALTNNNGYTYVYLGADLTMTAGVTVHSSKKTLVIDGLYIDKSPDMRTLIDVGGDAGMIIINSAMDVTFQNMRINGRNYFGIPRINDIAANEQTTLTYQTVTYTGPQMTWNLRGKTRYLDCDITTQPGTSIMNEVAEVRWLEIGGNTIIRHNPTSVYSTFFFYRTGASMTILENAKVEVIAQNNFLYRSGDNPAIVIQKGANFTLSTQDGFSSSNTHRVGSLLVDEKAVFRYIQKGQADGDASLCMAGPITANKDSNVYMEANFDGNTKRLISFDTTSNRGIYVNDAQSFVLYNRGTRPAILFPSTSVNAVPFRFTGNQVNVWETATPFENNAGDFVDVAPGRWHKKGWGNMMIRGSSYTPITTTDKGTTVLETTLIAEDIDPAKPLSMLELNKAQVLSVGNLPLTVDRVIVDAHRITGKTRPKARVKVDYKIVPFDSTIHCDADDAGDFVAPTEQEEDVPLGTSVTVLANTPFLLTEVVVISRYAEDLVIVSAPVLITFSPSPMSTSPLLLPRQVTSAPVTVSDMRDVKTPWVLKASITGPMQTLEGDTLINAVVFVPSAGPMVTMQIDVPQQVHIDSQLLVTTIVDWPANQGVLLHVQNPIHSGREYTTTLTWLLEEVVE